jgi:heterodisulfide reductase subunit B
MNKYLFYPGCSMQRSARPYLDSLVAIQEQIGLEFEEVNDWNCCGATEYVSVHRIPAFALIARNLALAAEQANGTSTIATGCSACYLNLAKTDSYMRKDPTLNELINQALAAGNLEYTPGSVSTRHLLDIIYNDIGLEAIEQQVVKPLKGLRVAPYYGCVLVRPDPDERFGNPEYPQSLDKLMGAIGAEVIDFPLKTHCCGGHMSQISEPVAFELIRRLIQAADQYRADVLVTLCPMCQLNLDAYQADMNKHFQTDYHIPVLYFTQLIGLALGREPSELGLGKEFVNSGPALSKIGVDVPEPEVKPKKKRRRRDDPSLPMPRMPEMEEEVL